MADNHCSHCPKSVRDWLVLLAITAGLGVLGTMAWVRLDAPVRAAQVVGLVVGGGVSLLVATLVVSAVRDGRESKDTSPVAAPVQAPPELEPEPLPLELEAAPEHTTEFPPLRLVRDGEQVA